MNSRNVLIGIMSAALTCTGGAMLVIQTAHAAGLSRPELLSWLFAVYVLGGMLNLALTVKYNIPFGGAHSITAVAFLSATAAHFSLSELAGAYMMAGILIAGFGLSGWFTKTFDFIPKPFIDALLAGLVFQYAVGIVPAVRESPLVGGLAVAGFIVAPKMFKAIPPAMGAIGFGIVGLLIGTDFPTLQHSEFYIPQLIMPDFTMTGFVSIALPMAVLILSNDIAVALGALRSNGFHPSVNKTLAVSGLATAVVSFFGGHSANVGGMMSTLCSSDEAGPKESRVWAAVVSSVLVIGFGLFAWKAVDLIEALPPSFVALITGFSLLGILLKGLQSAFSEASYQYSTLFTFVVAVSNTTLFGISAPVWALLTGVITAKLLGEGKKD